MKILTHLKNEINIAEIISDNIIINNTQDVIDILGNCYFLEVSLIIIYEKNINPVFFDLSTKLAGDILQKFSNYNMKLAIIGDFSKFESQSLKDFIYECNKSNSINFLNSIEEVNILND